VSRRASLFLERRGKRDRVAHDISSSGKKFNPNTVVLCASETLNKHRKSQPHAFPDFYVAFVRPNQNPFSGSIN